MNRLSTILHRTMLITALAVFAFLATPTAQAQGDIYTGTVYQDYNSDGDLDNGTTLGAVGDGDYTAAIDRPVSGVTVTLTDNQGVSVSTVSGANGSYSLNTAGLGPGPYRLEFTDLPVGLFTNPNTADAQTGTTVKFVPDGGGTYNKGLNNAQDYCQDDPRVISQCYVFGGQAGSDQPVLVTFPYGSGAEDTPDYRQTTNLFLNRQPRAHDIAVQAQEMGSTFGLGYDRRTGDIYTAAYMKRHSGYGPGGIGMIYRVEEDVNPNGAVEYFDMNSLPGNPAGVDFRDDADGVGTHDYLTDGGAAGLDAVGKISLGGMVADPFGRYLYVIALGNRTLYRLPIDRDAAPLTDTSEIISQPVPLANCPGGQQNVRPFSISYFEWEGVEKLYISVTCTAETSGDPADLRLLVYEADPETLAFGGVVFTAALNYPRGIANNQPGQDADWRAWSPTWNPTGGQFVVNPQPILSTVSFNRGDMIFSLRDRWGDQIGNEAASNPNDNTLYSGATAGDILRACGNPTVGWTLESAGRCQNGSGSGIVSADRPQGPGGGEFYASDEYQPFFTADPDQTPGLSADDRHDEVGLGASTQIPGFPALVATMFDPVYNNAGGAGFNSGGARWLDNRDGSVRRSYTLYTSATGGAPQNGDTFGKANGLGDIVEFCDLPPLEIGNRVWLDSNLDGTQGAAEQSFGGVTVSLWEDADGDGQPDPGGFVVSTTTSGSTGLNATVDDAGQYLFVENGNSNGVAGTGELPLTYNDGEWKYGTNYVVRLDNAADYTAGGPLEPYFITLLDADDQQRDSDGVATSGSALNPVPPGLPSLAGIEFPQAAFNVGFPGQHNHTYDFGFSDQVQPTDTPTPTDTPPPTDAPPTDEADTPQPVVSTTPPVGTPEPLTSPTPELVISTPGGPGTPGVPLRLTDLPPIQQTSVARGTPLPLVLAVTRLPNTGETNPRPWGVYAVAGAATLLALSGTVMWQRRRR